VAENFAVLVIERTKNSERHNDIEKPDTGQFSTFGRVHNFRREYNAIFRNYRDDNNNKLTGKPEFRLPTVITAG